MTLMIQVIRSVDGTFSSDFSQSFTYTPTAGFASSGLMVMKFVLNITGGQLAVGSANYSDIIDAIQFNFWQYYIQCNRFSY